MTGGRDPVEDTPPAPTARADPEAPIDVSGTDAAEGERRGRALLRLMETCPFEEGDVLPLTANLRDIEDEDGNPITDDRP